MSCLSFVLDRGPAYAWPSTDCQLSITIDLALCSLLTLLAVHLKGRSPVRTSIAALALPLLSPAAVLALHLASEHAPAYHAELVTRLSYPHPNPSLALTLALP